MFGLDARAARATWTVALVALALFVTWTVRRTLLIFVIALLFAYLLAPVVDFIDRRMQRRRSRNISLAIVYLTLLAIMVTAGVAIGSAVVEQAAALVERLPSLVQRFDEPSEWPLPEWLATRKAELTKALREQIEAHAKDVLPVLRRAGAGLLSLFANIPFLVLIPILSFFMLKDGEQLRDGFLNRFITDPLRRASLYDFVGDIHLVLVQFMRAVVILCILTFVFYAVFFMITGVPYSILLATIAGLLEFIPFVGPLAAAVVIILVAAFSGYSHVLWIVIFLVAYRVFQDYVIQPYLMSSGIELHPLLVIFGVFAGEQIGGVSGMFLSIPVLAALRVLALRIWKHKHDLTPAEP
ncbi:MAG: AI-2E family transporter [Bryobacteraceae bacterium]|nr:AI-2E family transporter [Bryobacteraceae bacterium]